MKMSEQILQLETTINFSNTALNMARKQLNMLKQAARPAFHETPMGARMFKMAQKMMEPFIRVKNQIDLAVSNPAEYRIQESQKTAAEALTSSLKLEAIGNKFWYKYVLAKMAKHLLEMKYLAGEYPDNQQLPEIVTILTNEVKRLSTLKPVVKETPATAEV